MHLAARPYTLDDYEACMALFESNVPKYFAQHERSDFIQCLDAVDPVDRPYLVLIENNLVRACGGLIIESQRQKARMAWGMVDSNFHNQGLGTILTEARIELACSHHEVIELGLETSQHTYGFYESFGFQTVGITPNGFADGLDRYDMVLKIKPSAI